MSCLKRLLKWLTLIFSISLISLIAASYFFIRELAKELPNINLLENVQYQTPLKIFSQDGLLIGQYGEMRRIPVNIHQIPPLQIKAFLAAEDDRFYIHPGVDYKGLLRAANQLRTTGKKTQGGSTITMQVARNFLLSKEKTFLRKLKEILLSLQIEKKFSKDQILELYLNKIYMGQRAYGIAAAAQTYYGKNLNELDLAQQAMIAGLPKAPSLFNPIINPDRALQRRNYVLKRMLALHYIDENQYQDALNRIDNAASQPNSIELEAPFIAEMVRQELTNKFGENTYTLGLNVFTTIPSHLQITADRALENALHLYDERHGYRGLPHKQLSKNQSLPIKDAIGDCRQALVLKLLPEGVSARLSDGSEISIPWQNMSWANSELAKTPLDQLHRKFIHPNDIIWTRQLADQSWALSQIPAVEGAFAALNPNNGAILAISGGFDYQHSQYNRATQAKRQPGSGFKPIIYTAALEKGYTPASIINDAPIVIEDPSQEHDWRPENYSRKFLGPTPLRVALRESINLVSIRLLQDIGIAAALDTAHRFGFETDQLPTTLSLALGSGYASPLRMASAYAIFANGGYSVKPYLIERIDDHLGHTIFSAKPPRIACDNCPIEIITEPLAPKMFSKPIVFLMNSLLRDVVQSGTATQAKQLGRSDLAGKTGTTNDQRDAWFNGFTPDMVASAWIGFDNSAPLGKGETGGKVALPMWIEFMKSALEDFPEKPFIPPEGIVQSYINPRDGLLLNINNKNGIWEYFTKETSPQNYSAVKPIEPREEYELQADEMPAELF